MRQLCRVKLSLRQLCRGKVSRVEQRAAVDLAVLGERHALHALDACGYHGAGEHRAHGAAELVDFGRTLEERMDAFEALVIGAAAALDTGTSLEGGVDLFQLDAVA